MSPSASQPLFDVVIIGGGPAGLAAGMYLARSGWRTALFEPETLGGQARKIEWIENYPGFPRGVSGKELMGRFAAQVRRWKLNVVKTSARKIAAAKAGFRVETGAGDYGARAAINCAGAAFRDLDLPGVKALLGHGIYHSAFDVASRFSGKRAAVVGGGDTAVHQALLLARRARRVTLIHRGGRLKAIALLQRRLRASANIETLFDTEVRRAFRRRAAPRGFLTGIDLYDLRAKTTRTFPVDGLFVLIGKRPGGALAPQKPPPGYFTAGDAAAGGLNQVVIAAGDGVCAAMRCERHLLNLCGS